jgi:hypothetical protein
MKGDILTVKELIEILSSFDPNKEISICGSDEVFIYDFYHCILLDHTEIEAEEAERRKEEQ